MCASDFDLNEVSVKFSNFVQWFRQFWHSECAATAVEYALMLGLIMLATVVGMGSLGQGANRSFDNTQSHFQRSP